MNKVFTFSTEEAFESAYYDIYAVMNKWLDKHPHYDCSIYKEVTDEGFKLIVDCNDITSCSKRLN